MLALKKNRKMQTSVWVGQLGQFCSCISDPNSPIHLLQPLILFGLNANLSRGLGIFLCTSYFEKGFTRVLCFHAGRSVTVFTYLAGKSVKFFVLYGVFQTLKKVRLSFMFSMAGKSITIFVLVHIIHTLYQNEIEFCVFNGW